MVEENSGKVKVTIEVEVNEALMSIAKELMESMPEMMKMFKKEKA